MRCKVDKPQWSETYLRIHPKAALKRLEVPYIYHIGRDELYELDELSESFLARCDGSKKGAELSPDPSFVEYCLEEGLLETLNEPQPVKIPVGIAPRPSLRYLELQLLGRCNLHCLHCYLGQSTKEELALEEALTITREFASLGGLRLLISGGEPMLYPLLKGFIEETAGLKLRRVLLTNGTLIDKGTVTWLINAEEIQFSLDGWQQGHDMLRGAGAFERTMKGIEAAKEAGIPISIATMIHRGNLGEFDRLRRFVEQTGAIEWGIDMMGLAGSLKDNMGLLVPYEQAAQFMHYAYGGGYHGSSEGYACGRHLMTVLPNGMAAKCGFYAEAPLGDARKGLCDCWLRLGHIPLDRLECKGCPFIEECAGGCRFRATGPLAPDPAMCAFYNFYGH